MAKLIKPNTVLPKGGELIPTKEMKIGHWALQKLDAKVTRHGIVWYRVLGGFGDKGDREDWVADVPGIAISVSDYQWREPRWGMVNVKSFDEAVAYAIDRGIINQQARIKAAECEIKISRAGLVILTAAQDNANR